MINFATWKDFNVCRLTFLQKAVRQEFGSVLQIPGIFARNIEFKLSKFVHSLVYIMNLQ
jgi:hypothetical protein